MLPSLESLHRYIPLGWVALDVECDGFAARRARKSELANGFRRPTIIPSLLPPLQSILYAILVRPPFAFDEEKTLEQDLLKRLFFSQGFDSVSQLGRYSKGIGSMAEFPWPELALPTFSHCEVSGGQVQTR